MNRFPHAFVLLALVLAFAPQGFSAQPQTQPPAAQAKGPDQRAGTLDMVVLLDKSLSMAPFFDKAKAYAAGNLIGAVLVPGDRLIVETVYGRTDRLLSMTIASEEDKAKAIRAIRGVKADGRFTDIGAALDAAKRDLDELGSPERPKYVLLISDERQEAPKGSPYQAPDHKLVHPSLEYVKKLDLGQFRVITVGLQVGAKVSQETPAMMQFLMDPPAPGGELGEAAGGAQAKSSGAGSQGSRAQAAKAPGGLTQSERALPSWLLYGAGGVLILAVLGVGAALIIAGKRKGEGGEGKTAESQ